MFKLICSIGRVWRLWCMLMFIQNIFWKVKSLKGFSNQYSYLEQKGQNDLWFNLCFCFLHLSIFNVNNCCFNVIKYWHKKFTSLWHEMTIFKSSPDATLDLPYSLRFVKTGQLHLSAAQPSKTFQNIVLLHHPCSSYLVKFWHCFTFPKCPSLEFQSIEMSKIFSAVGYSVWSCNESRDLEEFVDTELQTWTWITNSVTVTWKL